MIYIDLRVLTGYRRDAKLAVLNELMRLHGQANDGGYNLTYMHSNAPYNDPVSHSRMHVQLNLGHKTTLNAIRGRA